MNRVKPIRPDEIPRHRPIPDEVITVFNGLIAEKLRNDEAVIKQDEVVSRIVALLGRGARAEIFDNGWLDVEHLYREAGWHVEYDRPAYNEDYPATYKFKRSEVST